VRLPQKGPRIRHLQHAADIGWLPFIQKLIGGRSIRILSVDSLQQAQSDQSIQKITGRSRMQSQPALERIQVFGMAGKFGEYFDFDCPQQGLRGPKPKANLHDGIHCRFVRHYRNPRNPGALARWRCVAYACGQRLGQGAIEPRPPEPVMYRLTARLLLVLLLASALVPVALAISVPAPHACCMRKPMHEHGSGSRDIQAVDSQHHNCCPPVTTAHWAELGSGIDSSVHPLLACLSPDLQPIRLTNQANALRPVRGPPLS